MKALRLGLIGAGRWGRRYIETIGAIEGLELAIVASRNAETSSLVEPHTQILSNWAALLDCDLHGVVVATPPNLHAEMTLAAIDRGLPVMVEKPFTLSYAAAQTLADRARSRGSLVMVDHTHLFSPAFNRLKPAVAHDNVRSIVGKAGSTAPVNAYPLLWDWGAHDLAMCIDLLGDKPIRSHLAIQRFSNGETFDIDLTFPPDIPVRLTLSTALDRKTRLFTVATTTAAHVYDDQAEQKLVRYPLDMHGEANWQLGTPIALESGLPLTRAVMAFADAIRTGCHDHPSLQLGVDVVSALEMIQGSGQR